MVSRDYTKELGLRTDEKIIPLPLAIPLLVAIAVGAWYGVGALRAGGQHEVTPVQASAVTPPAGSAVASR